MKEPITKVVFVLLVIYALSYLIGDLTEGGYVPAILMSLYGLILIEYKDTKKIKILIIIAIILSYHTFLWWVFDWQGHQVIPQEETTEVQSVQEKSGN